MTETEKLLKQFKKEQNEILVGKYGTHEHVDSYLNLISRILIAIYEKLIDTSKEEK